MPRLTATTLAALAVLALAVVSGGCGGGGASKEEFQVEVVAARDRVDSALEQVTHASSVEDLLARLRIAAAELRSAATDVAEADAPDELDDEKRKLATTLRAFSQELVATVTTLENLHVLITGGYTDNLEVTDASWIYTTN